MYTIYCLRNELNLIKFFPASFLGMAMRMREIRNDADICSYLREYALMRDDAYREFWHMAIPFPIHFTLLLELLVSLSFTISPLNLWSVMCCISDFRFGRETFRWPDQHVRWQQQGPTPPFKKEIFCQI